jgi:Cu/Ag efflux protein CusF
MLGGMKMNKPHVVTLVAVLSACLLTAVSCSSDTKTEPTASASASTQTPAAKQAASSAAGARTVSVVEGEAGGVIEETFTASATVSAIDKATRKVTLQGEGGRAAEFTAPPEVQNFDQLRVGDKVSATVVSRLNVFVTRDQRAATDYAAITARNPKGAKPGAMVAESFEVVGTVKSIDTATRKAVLEFSGGEMRTVTVRDDVDLSKYKPGDRVVIRITQQLSVLAETP